ncbi:MAG: glycosyltransferase family 2 protein [Nanoarchaeota archaeon]|nr:glycosyltransferase family 2 protein [Nanoarchaeota archaeon]
MTTLSVVMPVYNEEDYIEEALSELTTLLDAWMKGAYELIVVENGSTDKTRSCLAKLEKKYRQLRVLFYPDGANYGGAIRYGFLNAKGEYVLNCSADWYDVAFMRKALPFLKTYDGVLSSKFMNKTTDNRGAFRKLVSFGYNLLLLLLFQRALTDTHGINLYRTEVVQPIAKLCKTGHSLFPTELVLRCERKGLRLKHLPIRIKEKRNARKPILGRALKTIVGVIRMRLLLFRDPSF